MALCRSVVQTIGEFFSCGLHEDGSVECWGEPIWDPMYWKGSPADPPAGTFKRIFAGRAQVCGLRPDDTLECWGYNDGGLADPPPGTFESFAGTLNFSCGLRTDGTITCWGSDTYHGLSAPSGGRGRGMRHSNGRAHPVLGV